MDFRPIDCGDEAFVRYQALFAACFSPHPKFSPETLRWLYESNPEGRVVGFDAFDGDMLAAHYACVPARVSLGGAVVRALLSLNTATHPAYAGQGLFTRLAGMTYEAAAREGFDAVYGVANANSTPGFVKRLGFQLVHPLRAAVGMGPIGMDVDRAATQSQFRRVWTPQALAWRCANPVNPVGATKHGYAARGPHVAVGAYAELPGVAPAAIARASWRPMRLFLGLLPQAAGNALRAYADIPRSLRPSPLNLIYLPLGDVPKRLDAGQVFFNFLDFDAY
jgi:GNAT superfamily N-acetyltransferase